jgi:glycine hydroxymethyltransferase
MMGADMPNPMGITGPKGDVRPLSALLDLGVFPGTQGGPLEHIIAAKAVAFGEALQPSFKAYMQRVRENAQAMASALMNLGYNIVSGGTDNHLMLIDLRNKGVTGKLAEKALEKAEITLNKNMVPFDSQSPMITSGIRVGTPAITTRGLGTADMVQIVEWIDSALKDPENDVHLAKIGKEVHDKMYHLPLFASHSVENV